MKKTLNRLCCCALAIGTLGSLSSALAAEPSTVHAALASSIGIYNESVDVGFFSEDGKPVRPISYNGSVYLPVRTAGEWMGKNVAWDQTTATVSLTGSTTPQVRAFDSDATPLTDQDRADLDVWGDSGMDVQLRPDVTVTVDGQTQSFVNVNGESVSPIAFHGTTFLPLRSIGELCGKTVTFAPSASGNGGNIYIRKAMTETETSAVQGYLDQAAALLTKTGEAGRQYLTKMEAGAASAELLPLAKTFLTELTAMRQLPKPSAAYFDASYQTLQEVLGEGVSNCTLYIDGLEKGVAVWTGDLPQNPKKVPTAEDVFSLLRSTYIQANMYCQSEREKFLMAGDNSHGPFDF